MAEVDVFHIYIYSVPIHMLTPVDELILPVVLATVGMVKEEASYEHGDCLYSVLQSSAQKNCKLNQPNYSNNKNMPKVL